MSFNPKTILKSPISCTIIEQPNDLMRFRYVSEKTCGRIVGKNHSNDNKVYPAIQIRNYIGNAVIRVSCVTKKPENTPRPHPHNLVQVKKDVADERCYDGIFEVTVRNSDVITFSNLGMFCVKKDEIDTCLQRRIINHGVDPFGTGIGHPIAASDLHCLRLCFEIFIGSLENHQQKFVLVSNPITNVKDLVIYKLSHASGFVEGGQEILMFCEKIVAKSNIQIRFFEEINGETVWEGFGNFQQSDVHKQYGIAFKIPAYRYTNITEPVPVKIELRRTDGTLTYRSAPRDFLYVVNETNEYMKQKRKRTAQSSDLSQHPPLPRDNTHEIRPFIDSSYINFGPIQKPVTSHETSHHITRIPSNTLNIPYTIPSQSSNVPVQFQEQAELNIMDDIINNLSVSSQSIGSTNTSYMPLNIPSQSLNISPQTQEEMEVSKWSATPSPSTSHQSVGSPNNYYLSHQSSNHPPFQIQELEVNRSINMDVPSTSQGTSYQSMDSSNNLNNFTIPTQSSNQPLNTVQQVSLFESIQKEVANNPNLQNIQISSDSAEAVIMEFLELENHEPENHEHNYNNF